MELLLSAQWVGSSHTAGLGSKYNPNRTRAECAMTQSIGTAALTGNSLHKAIADPTVSAAMGSKRHVLYQHPSALM